MKLGSFALALACAGLAACSSIIEGTSQEISVNTNPEGADCALNRQGMVIAHVTPTPGEAKIEKTKDDITIVCDKDGFEQATFLDHSGSDAATVGNIILGGGIGWAIDSASGADNKYDSPVNITLVQKAAAQGTGAATPAAQPSGSTEGAGSTTAVPQASASTDGATDGTAASTLVPQQLATIAPSSSSPLASPAPARGRYDGEWRGRAAGRATWLCTSEPATVMLTIVHSGVSGQLKYAIGAVEFSGEVSADGSFETKGQWGRLIGNFEEDQFGGTLSMDVASGCSYAVSLERVKG